MSDNRIEFAALTAKDLREGDYVPGIGKVEAIAERFRDFRDDLSAMDRVGGSSDDFAMMVGLSDGVTSLIITETTRVYYGVLRDRRHVDLSAGVSLEESDRPGWVRVRHGGGLDAIPASDIREALESLGY